MHNTSRCLGFLSLLIFSMHSLADISCPQMPSAVTSVNRDVRSEINASVGSLGKVKAGEVGTKTEVVAKNLFDKYPNVDKLLALQTMSATYCSMLRDSALKEGEKIDRWEKFQEKVLNLQPSPQNSPTIKASKRSEIPSSIKGTWVIQATENTPKTYLNFKPWNGKLTGNTEILYSWTPFQQTGILEGEVTGNRITFVTKRYYPGLNTPLKHFVHRYEGRIDGNKINFTVQLEGGAFEEVTARKLLQAKRLSNDAFDWVDGEVTYRADKKTPFEYEIFQTPKEACLFVFPVHYGYEENKGWEDISAEESGTEVRCIAKYADGRPNVVTLYGFINILLTCPKNSVEEIDYQKEKGERRCKCDDEYLAKNRQCVPPAGA